ncbi:hypothetical protein L218DRAFT_949505 [Marasmius fiardii PR-910]|nr:hypothetical protein L218DRAFT_949505 [Marasmius fiardii PR-910]
MTNALNKEWVWEWWPYVQRDRARLSERDQNDRETLRSATKAVAVLLDLNCLVSCTAQLLDHFTETAVKQSSAISLFFAIANRVKVVLIEAELGTQPYMAESLDAVLVLNDNDKEHMLYKDLRFSSDPRGSDEQDVIWVTDGGANVIMRANYKNLRDYFLLDIWDSTLWAAAALDILNRTRYELHGVHRCYWRNRSNYNWHVNSTRRELASEDEGHTSSGFHWLSALHRDKTFWSYGSYARYLQRL